MRYAACLAVLIFLVWGRPAIAAGSPFRFPITIASTESPDIVCVVGRASSRTAIATSDVLQDVFDSKSTEWSYKAITAADVEKLKPTLPPGVQQKTWDFELEIQRALLLEVQAALEKYHAVTTPKTGAACIDPDESCQASVEGTFGIKRDQWGSLLCAPSPHRQTPARRVAFVGIDFHGEETREPTLVGARFDGRVLTADFAYNWTGDPIFSIQSLGGTYHSEEARLGVQTGTVVELFPRCVQRVVQLPRLARDAASAPAKSDTATVTLASGRQCRAALSAAGQFDVSLPVERSEGALGAITATLPSALGSGVVSLRDAEFEVAWSGRVPPAVLGARVTQLNFEWERHCLYHGETCPSVELPDVGRTCDPGYWTNDYSRCAYHCALVGDATPGAQSAPGASLPLKAVFRPPVKLLASADAAHRESLARAPWTEPISAVDQRVDGFVPPASYTIEVDARSWLHRPTNDMVDWIDFVLPTGGTRRVVLSNASVYVVAVPGARCSDGIVIQAHGDRRYEDISFPIVKRQTCEDHGGEIVLPPPEWAADRIAFGIDGAYAWIVPLQVTGIRGEGRSTAGATPAGILGAWLALRPSPSSVYYEANLGFVFSSRRAFATRIDVHDPSSVWVPYYRVPIVLSMGRALATSLDVGAGAGVVLGAPLSDRNAAVFGSLDVAATLMTYLRLRASRDIGLELRLSALFGEDVYAYDTDFKGGVWQQTGRLTSLSIALGVRWDMASGRLWKEGQ